MTVWTPLSQHTSHVLSLAAQQEPIIGEGENNCVYL